MLVCQTLLRNALHSIRDQSNNKGRSGREKSDFVFYVSPMLDSSRNSRKVIAYIRGDIPSKILTKHSFQVHTDTVFALAVL